MIWDYDFILWILDNQILLFQFVICIIAPFIGLLFLSRALIDKLRRLKRINNIMISEYNYNIIKRNAYQLNETIKKRIETILNTAGNRY